jgi:hypothetical protein
MAKPKQCVHRGADWDRANELLRIGKSHRQVAALIPTLARSTISFHARRCLQVSKSPDTIAVELARVKFQEHENDLDAALRDALALKEKAEKTENIELILKAQATVNRVLGLRQSTRKPPRDSKVFKSAAQVEAVRRGFNIVCVYPGDLTPEEKKAMGYVTPTPEEIAEADLVLPVSFCNRRPPTRWSCNPSPGKIAKARSEMGPDDVLLEIHLRKSPILNPRALQNTDATSYEEHLAMTEPDEINEMLEAEDLSPDQLSRLGDPNDTN